MSKVDLNSEEIRKEVNIILSNNRLSDDLKLYRIFEIYKEYLKDTIPSLYYTILAWKDSHLNELFKEISSINEINKEKL